MLSFDAVNDTNAKPFGAPFSAGAGQEGFQVRMISRRGFALAEAVVATGILAFVFGGLFSVANRSKNLVRRGDVASETQRNCLARVDQLRALGWAKVTRADQISALLAVPTSTATFTREAITVYPAAVPQTYPVPSPAPAATTVSTTPLFTVTKTGTAAPVISPANFDNGTSLATRQLNFRVLTTSQSAGSTIERELSTIISKSAAR
jgi:hypothetical protein